MRTLVALASVMLCVSLSFGDEPDASARLVGTWVMRTAEVEIRIVLKADGTFQQQMRNAQGAQENAGRWRLAGSVLVAEPKGEEAAVRMNVRMPDANTLELTDANGDGVRFVRVRPGERTPSGAPTKRPTPGHGTAELVGRWTAQTEEGPVTVVFGADGAFGLREADGTAYAGRYQVGPQAIDIRLQGVDGVVRYPYRRLADGSLQVTDEDGSLLVFRRVQAPKRPEPGPADPPATPTRPAPGGQVSGPSMVFTPHRCMDVGGLKHPGTGQWLEAFRMLVPQGWRFQGGVQWKIHQKSPTQITRSDLASPALVAFSVTTPDGRAGVHVYPDERFVDTSAMPAARFGFFRPGSRYAGALVSPPLDPHQYVTRVLMPGFHKGASSVRIVQQRPAPELAAHFTDEARRFNAAAGVLPNVQMSIQAGTTMVDYAWNGVAYREQFFVANIYIKMPGMVMWWPRASWSLRAPRAEFAALAPAMLTSVYSVRFNALWFLLYMRLVDKNWRGIAVVDNLVAKIDSEIVASRVATNHKINKQVQNILLPFRQFNGPDNKSYYLPSDRPHFINPDNGFIYTGPRYADDPNLKGLDPR